MISAFIWTDTIEAFILRMMHEYNGVNRGRSFVLFELKGKSKAYIYMRADGGDTSKALNKLSKLQHVTNIEVSDATIIVHIPAKTLRLISTTENIDELPGPTASDA